MGVLNVTPDSFFDGGQYSQLEAALKQTARMLADGADIIDVGGESSRPNAKPVDLATELRRTLPVIEAIKKHFPETILSIDTTKLEVMRLALAKGVRIINDISGLQTKQKINLVAAAECQVCVMHMQGNPQTMQQQPHYTNVVQTLINFFEDSHQRLLKAGIDETNIIYDPGFGFGKSLAHNIQLFKSLTSLKSLCQQLGGRLLIGVSRKSMIGAISQVDPVSQRLIGSVTAAVLAAQAGADMLRVHDVAETRQALLTQQTLSAPSS